MKGFFQRNFLSSKKKVFLLLFLSISVLISGTFFFGKDSFFRYAFYRGNHYFNGGEYDLEKAKKWYKVAALIDPQSELPHYQFARIYFVESKLSEAKKEIDVALSKNPENKRAFYIRGLIDGFAKNYEEAQADFEKFVAWAPNEWAGYNDLSWVYFEDKKFKEAAEAAEKGLKKFPDNPWLLNGAGISEASLGNDEEGEEYVSRAKELSEKMTENDWKRAYPGNDPDEAAVMLADFRAGVESNLLASENGIADIIGRHFSACASAGSHDVSDCSGTYGWACSPDHPTSNFDVYFYIDGPPGGGGTLFQTGIAYQYRQDLVDANVCGGTGNHAFTAPYYLGQDGRPIYVYAMDNVGLFWPVPNTPKSLPICPASISLSYSCSNPTNQITFNWSSHPQATYYALRVDNTTQNVWNPQSCNVINPGDFCANVVGTSQTLSFPAGAVNNFSAWVHPCGPLGCSAPTLIAASCGTCTMAPTCGAWGACSVGCGGGTQTRTCWQADCTTYAESQACNANPCQDRNWREVAP